ncbi:hypothetical protein AURDEDRAFT_177868 [Auricularia subglabra TFB-10046 SS5]|uniref:BTB domain-containing protein n=1 Tax=Auricularia subglabra (strain TFB-10046 / SS5) TaxID=717982 RepID=J0CS16_AURST|nr:hypothetical protein AURDEDRAFT_177868 [Auricularia subglabra TFB-10046 SS5]
MSLALTLPPQPVGPLLPPQQAPKPHRNFKFSDANFFLLAEATLFMVHSGMLRRCKMFSNMFGLPQTDNAKKQEDGYTRERPLFIPQVLAVELDVVLNFVYFEWPGPDFTVLGFLRLLALSDRFGIPTARDYALRSLNDLSIPPILRVEYGLLCEVEGWPEQGFMELMLKPLHDIADCDAHCASPDLLLAIVKARSQVDLLRRQTFVQIPDVPHAPTCSLGTRELCTATWRNAWCTGLCRLYLNPGEYAPVPEITDKLNAAAVANMDPACLRAVKDAIVRDKVLTRELELYDTELVKVRALTRTPRLYTPALPAPLFHSTPAGDDDMIETE